MSDKEVTRIAGAAAMVTIMIGTVFITYQPMGWVLSAAAIVFLITAMVLASEGGEDKKDEGL